MTFALSLMLLAATPNAGDVAPDFTVRDVEGKEQKLSQLVEKGPVVLAFFPKARTSGCTKEMEGFRDRFKDFESSSAKVLAVSTDDGATLLKWKVEMKAPQTFISDKDGELVKLYDVKMPVTGWASRHTFVIGKDRKVLEHHEGSDAVDTSKAVAACSLKKPAPK